MSSIAGATTPVPRKLTDGVPHVKLGPTDAVIWLFICVCAAVVTVSLVTNLHDRMVGTTTLEDLARWGDFWGGHLNSLTFALLASTLLLQRQQMKEQREALVKELEAQRLASIQHSLQFALEQLTNRSERLAFRTISIDTEGRQSFGDVTFGLFAMGAAVQASLEAEDAPQVCCDPRAVKDYHVLAKNAIETLASLGHPIEQICRPLVGTLVPSWFIDYREKLDGEEVETRRIVNQHLPGRIEEWKRHIEDGWRIEMCSVIMNRPYLVITRKALHDPQRRQLEGTSDDSEAILLERALDYMI
jgi:hypothetical protein